MIGSKEFVQGLLVQDDLEAAAGVREGEVLADKYRVERVLGVGGMGVVVAATHCFDKTLLDTVIQGNVNPIEKVERSLMIVATTIHGRPAIDLLTEDQRDRFLAF